MSKVPHHWAQHVRANIIGHYNPSVRISEWRDQQPKIDFERQILKNFSWEFLIYSQSFWQKSAERGAEEILYLYFALVLYRVSEFQESLNLQKTPYESCGQPRKDNPIRHYPRKVSQCQLFRSDRLVFNEQSSSPLSSTHTCIHTYIIGH